MLCLAGSMRGGLDQHMQHQHKGDGGGRSKAQQRPQVPAAVQGRTAQSGMQGSGRALGRLSHMCSCACTVHTVLACAWIACCALAKARHRVRSRSPCGHAFPVAIVPRLVRQAAALCQRSMLCCFAFAVCEHSLWSAAAQVHRKMSRASRDIRFDEILANACQDDRKQYCFDVQPVSSAA